MRGTIAFITILFVCAAVSTDCFALKKEFDFMGIKLGMTDMQISNAVSQNPNLKIDDSRYLGKINESIPYTLKIDSHPYIQNIFIQFYQGKSFLIILLLDNKYFDFYNLTERLEDKYGIPSKKTSKIVKWEDNSNSVQLVLENPSTLKVYDYAIMLKLQTELSQKSYLLTNSSILQYEKNLILGEL
ncbi:MAG: hypothetical protein A2Y33_00095 [Spirochaetes bacterium GWF1_51_8]|nr:MAG: hypothetical protein A2Y33_00095 [Spirochaetes bacterium GWF1_51_8]